MVENSLVEGVDDEVLLAFTVLLVIAISIIIYFINTSSNLSFGLNERLRSATTRLTSFNQEHVDQNASQTSFVETEGHEPIRFSPNNGNSPEAGNYSSYRDLESIGTDLPGRNHTLTTGMPPAQPHDSDQSSEQFSVRVKHHEVERAFTVQPSITVGELKRFTFPEEFASGRRVRFIYSGRLLHDETASISFYGVSNHSVIHAQISDVPHNSSPSGNDDVEIEFDISRLFIPLLAAILCGCWYGLVTFRQLFDSTSTAILVILTTFYAFMVYVMFC